MKRDSAFALHAYDAIYCTRHCALRKRGEPQTLLLIILPACGHQTALAGADVVGAKFRTSLSMA